MARRRALPPTVGRPLPAAYEQALLRELRPMLRAARRASSRVRTVREARRLGVALRRRWPDKRIRAIVERVGRKAEQAASRPWAPVLRARGDSGYRTDAYDGDALLERWSREAVRLITSVRDETAEGMRKDILRAAREGVDPATLAETWRRKGLPVLWGTLEGRVRVIAQHQISMLQSQVQRERARAVGVREFVWRTQGDDRVRDAHQALAGRTFAYDDPPSEGLPGQPVNCRCWAESVIPDELLAEIEGVIDR